MRPSTVIGPSLGIDRVDSGPFEEPTGEKKKREVIKFGRRSHLEKEAIEANQKNNNSVHGSHGKPAM